MENIETKQNKHEMIELSMDCNGFGMTKLNHIYVKVYAAGWLAIYRQIQRKPNNAERTSCAFFNSFKTLVDIVSVCICRRVFDGFIFIIILITTLLKLSHIFVCVALPYIHIVYVPMNFNL